MEDQEDTIKDIVHVSGMYQEWFLDYASYVILERAVPHIEDGLKPVQRRILHALKDMDDGRYNKVANVIGQTMKFHPHGDASIGDAMVQIGQKDLLLDTQGNWGNIFTGDKAAAPRYIEVRLSPFSLDVLFNKNTHCLICCERLISCFYMRSYGNFCKSCGYAAFNNPLGDEHYFSKQFFWLI